jgi:hypothetical protein
MSARMLPARGRRGTRAALRRVTGSRVPGPGNDTGVT